WARDSEFAALLKGSTMLTFYFVVESYLRRAFAGTSQLGSLMQRLSMHRALTLHQADRVRKKTRLQIIGIEFKAAPDATIRSAVSGTFSGTHVTRLELALALAGPIRNHGAHGVESLPIVAERFDDVLQLVLNGTFAVLDLV